MRLLALVLAEQCEISLTHAAGDLKVVLSQAGWQVGFGKLVEESSAYRLIAGALQCFRDGTVGREFEHYGRLGLEYVELILVSQEGLSKFCIRERRDSPGAGSTHRRVWLVGSRSTCSRALAFWASNGHGYGSLRALVARLALMWGGPSLPVVAWAFPRTGTLHFLDLPQHLRPALPAYSARSRKQRYVPL